MVNMIGNGTTSVEFGINSTAANTHRSRCTTVSEMLENQADWQSSPMDDC
jgi:hypothetical protein